ncbi:major facilitator superfamily domain-containing protein [Apodospora peruviana]|uniref:Major facilitator superfamily domain-containing protein n=1 Tax=Apodospora peruviana TaxID=516989 RepID=A0AAE0I2L6_9PEZI|nr:major facilitator superfamily domain-containing protein [Apodospora peruviana]
MADEKKGDSIGAVHNETNEESTHFAAERGHVATDKYGQPLVHFDPKAEARLRLKIDLYIVPTVSLLYLFCFIDRANIGNARIAGLTEDLQLKGYDYNMLLSIFYISYILFEIPSNVACKWIGPGWFIPAISLGFGASSIATGFVKTTAQAAGVRFVLGVFEAGMMPGIAYYLSRWYRRSELAFRLALYIVMAPMAGAFGGLLASGILTLDHFGSVHSWRMIFVIEGIITCGLSIIAFFTLTDRPATARWLTAEEKDLAIARVKSERIGQDKVLDNIDKKKLWLGIISPMTLSTSLIFLLNNITVQGLAFFAPTIVRTIYPDKTTVTQQLFTVPPYVVGGFFTLLMPFLCTHFDRRQIFMILCTPMVMVGYIMFLASSVATVRYAATFLIASSLFALGPITNAQVSANVISDTARSSAIGMNVMMGNIGGLISTWSFLPTDAPDYHIGNGLNLATASTCLIIATLMLFWMKMDNKKRDGRSVEEELAGMSQGEIQDLDWKHPAWRWNP